ncbi:response regulator [Spirosoma oryzicola]|uniref:response regulator n=1 Tax=Spirosoma oryzicola TaxID=2898794 RepID=UPI001E44F0B3|nr:response regulator [Spirosoma oryzicola]UHG93958.1 response regulator [Spirosoma oryzicola]
MTLQSTPCVFLVDDDEDDRFLVQQVFKQYNPEFTLKSFFNGQELLNALAVTTRLPKLVLLDLNMPFMGGLEALAFLRKDAKYDTMPIVILTTSDNYADKQRATELKANDFFTKPGAIDELNQLLLKLRHKWLIDQNTTNPV